MSSDEEPSLAREIELFERNRKDWAQAHPGEFVVICGSEVGNFYPDFESALRAALRRFGPSRQFLVKQVWAEEPVFFIY